MDIQLDKLSDEQLDALFAVNPEAIMNEKNRRDAYFTMEAALADLSQAYVELTAVIDNSKVTKATKAVKDTKILDVTRKLINTARNHGFQVDLKVNIEGESE